MDSRSTFIIARYHRFVSWILNDWSRPSTNNVKTSIVFIGFYYLDSLWGTWSRKKWMHQNGHNKERILCLLFIVFFVQMLNEETLNSFIFSNLLYIFSSASFRWYSYDIMCNKCSSDTSQYCMWWTDMNVYFHLHFLLLSHRMLVSLSNYQSAIMGVERAINSQLLRETLIYRVSGLKKAKPDLVEYERWYRKLEDHNERTCSNLPCAVSY